MNCKPNQLAWIVVPRDQRPLGFDQIDGHVVTTEQLLSGFVEPTWRISPHQVITVRVYGRSTTGEVFCPGQSAVTAAIPDSWLRPFDPLAAPQMADIASEQLV